MERDSDPNLISEKLRGAIALTRTGIPLDKSMLIEELFEAGHEVHFDEQDQPVFSPADFDNRDYEHP